MSRDGLKSWMTSTALAMATALAFAMIACGGGSEPAKDGASPTPKKEGAAAAGGQKEKIKIGFLVKQPEEPWFRLEWKFAQQAADQYGFELLKLPAKDGQEVMNAIDNIATKGAKGFVICTPDVRLGPAIVAKAIEKNLKFMTVDDQFVDANGKFMTGVRHLGISARKIGENVGNILSYEMKRRGWKPEETGACVVTYEELDTAKDRTDGAIATLQSSGFPKDRIFKAPQKTSDVPGAMAATDILLTQHPDMKRWLVAGMNDSAVMGAVRAMETKGFNAETIIGIGINGTDCIQEFEKDKPNGFWGSMLLQPRRHGFDTAVMVYKWVAEGKEPAMDTRTIGILIGRDNFRKILKDEGIREK